MSEKQTQNPEASKQAITDLYQQAASYLETSIHSGLASIKPGSHIDGGMLKISADVPALNGKHLTLSYERPATDDDTTIVDTEMPLAWTDEAGKNHWVTWISIKVFDGADKLLHDYDVVISPDPDHATAYDQAVEDPETREFGTITALDAKEINAHLEWALEHPQD
jgi:hypothetical protein